MKKVRQKTHIPEVTSACPDFGVCGGCCYADLLYESELALKERVVLDLLDKEGISGYDYLGIIPAPSVTGYKNKMEFSFGDSGKGGSTELGIRKQKSRYEVITPRFCDIIDDDFKAVLLYSLDFFRESGEGIYHKTRHTGTLRNLVIRKAHTTGGIMVNIVTTSGFNTGLAPYTEGIMKLDLNGEVISILHTHVNTVADFIKPDKTVLLHGQDYITEELFGLKFKISPFSFFQTNTAGAAELYAYARDLAQQTGAQTAMDLYSGTGTIAQIVSGFVPEVTGVEIVPEAVAAARENAAVNNIKCRFICGDVLEVLSELKDAAELVILDPPRAGIHPKAITRIIQAAPKYIIYISCKPESLARDLNILTAARYSVKSVKLCDMFPRTAHIESIALLVR